MRRGKAKKPRQMPTVRLSERGERMVDEALAEVERGRVRAYGSVGDLIADLRGEAAGD